MLNNIIIGMFILVHLHLMRQLFSQSLWNIYWLLFKKF